MRNDVCVLLVAGFCFALSQVGGTPVEEPLPTVQETKDLFTNKTSLTEVIDCVTNFEWDPTCPADIKRFHALAPEMIRTEQCSSCSPAEKEVVSAFLTEMNTNPQDQRQFIKKLNKRLDNEEDYY